MPRAKNSKPGSKTRADPLMAALERNVLKVLEPAQNGLADDAIRVALNMDVKPRNLINAYNSLLQKGRIQLVERPNPNGSGNVVYYNYVSPEDAKALQGLDASDRLVMDLIEKSGEEGITKREIKMRSNINNAAEVKQIVDGLLSRKLIKEVKSIQGARKVIYISAKFEASVAHTGGPWFNDEKEFDTEFIETLYARVLKYIKRRGPVTLEQVTSVVAEQKISIEELSKEHIKELMSTMVYDGSVETFKDKSDENRELYRFVRPTPAVNHLATVPCGSCPLIKDCAPGAVISPQSCVYMSEWLKGAELW